jgi:hypothetical protein
MTTKVQGVLVVHLIGYVEGARAEDVLKIWQDVSSWSKWDPAVRSAQLEGNFKSGGRITVFHKYNRDLSILRISDVSQNSFKTEAESEFGDLLVERKIESKESGIELTHGYYLLSKNDHLKDIFKKTVEPLVARDFQQAIKNICDLLSKKGH